MLRHGYVVLLASFLALPALARADDNAKELEKFAGTWTVLSMERAGKKTDTDELKQLDLRLIIKGKDYESKAGDRAIDKGILKIDASKKPMAIDILPEVGPGAGKSILAIYEFNGDEMRVCYDLAGKDRPLEFKTKEGTQQLFIVYKKAK